MSRPSKKRKICNEPSCEVFGPISGKKSVQDRILMTLDEYEALRLIDLEGITQEQCAVQMDVARSTAQNIYRSAREKLARSLVYGMEIQIEGGNYQICDGSDRGFGCTKCRYEKAEETNVSNENNEEPEAKEHA